MCRIMSAAGGTPRRRLKLPLLPRLCLKRIRFARRSNRLLGLWWFQNTRDNDGVCRYDHSENISS